MPTIKIAGHDVLLDEEDLHLMESTSWFIRRSGGTSYVQHNTYAGHEYSGYESLHRLIAGCGQGDVVDHINGNGLDNRRCNLRICSHAENLRNRKIHANNNSGFKGVYFDRSLSVRPWRAQIRVAGKKFNLGRYSTAEEASQAYKKAAVRLHGEFARLA